MATIQHSAPVAYNQGARSNPRGAASQVTNLSMRVCSNLPRNRRSSTENFQSCLSRECERCNSELMLPISRQVTSLALALDPTVAPAAKAVGPEFVFLAVGMEDRPCRQLHRCHTLQAALRRDCSPDDRMAQLARFLYFDSGNRRDRSATLRLRR